MCVFCRNNGEDESVYSTHALKSPDGKVTCPILFAYECPICRATGENAHTLKYCARNPNSQGQPQNGGNNGGYQGYSGNNNMGYSGNTTNTRPNANNTNINTNIMQAMLQLAQMNGGSLHPAIAQLNFNMAAMIYQQQMQQNQPGQASNPYAEWVQQQQQQNPQQQQQNPQQQQQNPQQQQQQNPQQQQYTGSENKNYTGYPSLSSYSPSYPGYSSYNYQPASSSYPPYQGSSSSSNDGYQEPAYSPSASDIDNNLSNLFGKANIDDIFQSYSR